MSKPKPSMKYIGPEYHPERIIKVPEEPSKLPTPNTLRAVIMHSIGLEKGTRRYVLTIKQLDRVEQAIIDFMVNLAPDERSPIKVREAIVYNLSAEAYNNARSDYIANIRRSGK